MQADVKIADPQARALVSKLVVERSQNILFVKADLSTAQLPAGTNREVWMQPVLSAGDSSVVLPAVAVAGRNRFYQVSATTLTVSQDWNGYAAPHAT